MTAQGNGNNLLVQGRLIWTLGSDMFAGQVKTDMQTKAPIISKDGVNPVIEYGFGLAIPKIDPATGQNTEEYIKVWQALNAEAMTLYPSGQIPQDFAMKYKDGDAAIDKNGKSYAEREGYAGHFVLTCTTRIPIKYFIYQGGNNVLVNDGIKCGDYVNAQLNIKAHPAIGQGKAGLYVNPGCVQLIAPGKEIINAPSGDQVFGQAAPGYNGQIEQPVQPAMPAMATPGAPVMPAAALAPGSVDPHYGVLPPGHQPVQPMMPAPGGVIQGNPYAAPQMPVMGNPPAPVVGHPAMTAVGAPPAMPGSVPPAYPGNPAAPTLPGYVPPTPVIPGMPGIPA